MNKKKVCVWCWFKTFNEFLSWWEICPICNYQDSIMWLFDPFTSDANGGLTLIEYQKWTLDNIWYTVNKYQKWKNLYFRDENWKVINEDNFDKSKIYLPHYYYSYLDNPIDSFFEKFKEAQKYNPDEKVHLNL